MLVNSMNPVLVLIKWKARIDFWKSQMETWHRLSRRYQHAGESWIAHDNGNKSAFKDFFLSPVLFYKIYQFLTFFTQQECKVKGNLCTHHPPQDLIQWFAALRFSRQTEPLDNSRAVREEPSTRCASQLCWPNNPTRDPPWGGKAAQAASLCF